MASKPTSADYRKRVNQVSAMLSTGSPRADICEYVREKYASSVATADRYIAQATSEMQTAADSTREEDVTRARAVYQLILREQIGRADLRGAAMTTDKLAHLLGLNAPARVEQSGAEGGPIEIVVRRIEKPLS